MRRHHHIPRVRTFGKTSTAPSDVIEHNEQAFRFEQDPATGAGPLELLLVRLQRAGSTVRGPGVLGAPSLLLALLHALGPCTIVLYSEGLHHGNGLATQALQESHFVLSTRQALEVLLNASAAVRAAAAKAEHTKGWAGLAPIVAAWEVVAQHFDTADGSGAYEQRPGFNRSSGTPLMSYYSSNGYKYAAGECVETSPGVHDWRNSLLKRQVLQTPDHHADHGAQAAWLPGFYASSQAWGPLMHVHRGDCTHTWCYSPYFFARLWMSLAELFKGRGWGGAVGGVARSRSSLPTPMSPAARTPARIM